MARLVVGVALAIVLGAVVTGVWLPRGASAHVMYWSRSQSNCADSSAEDPVHLVFRNIRVTQLLSTVTWRGAVGAATISNRLWDSSATGSSSSYYNFNDGSGCHDHDAYAANHAFWNDGSHVRFWQGLSNNWQNVRGAAHHDVVHACAPFTKHKDTSDRFNESRDALAQFWGLRRDAVTGARPWRVVWVTERSPGFTPPHPCGVGPVWDDGLTAVISQAAGSIAYF